MTYLKHRYIVGKEGDAGKHYRRRSFRTAHQAATFIESWSKVDLGGVMRGEYYIDDMALDPAWRRARRRRAERKHASRCRCGESGYRCRHSRRHGILAEKIR